MAKLSYAKSDVPAISLDNTDFVVSLAFMSFLAVIIYLKVPSKINQLLDDRSRTIDAEIKNATSILEEAKTMLAELEREHKTNIEKAEQIVIDAEVEAKNMLLEVKKEVRASIERRVKLAEDQIRANEILVIKSIRDNAIDQAILMAQAKLIKSANKKSTLNGYEEILKENLK